VLNGIPYVLRAGGAWRFMPHDLPHGQTAYQTFPESREAMIDLAMSRVMRRRLARQAPYGVPSPQRQGLRGLARAF
jgi:transposase